jgi:hypothetical protein
MMMNVSYKNVQKIECQILLVAFLQVIIASILIEIRHFRFNFDCSINMFQL